MVPGTDIYPIPMEWKAGLGFCAWDLTFCLRPSPCRAERVTGVLVLDFGVKILGLHEKVSSSESI